MRKITHWVFVATAFVALTACGGGGNPPSDDANVTDQNQTSNTPPTANAGADQTITEGQSVTLTCQGSDADGDTLSYRWLSGNTELSVTATYATPNTLGVGEYSYTCEISDGSATATDEVTVTVNPKPNTPPTADAGADQTITEGGTTTLACIGSDVDSDTLSYKWLKGSTKVSDTNSYTTPTTLSVGEYTYTCEVSDGQATATDDVKVTVNPKPNTAPTVDINATPTTAPYGTTISFDASGSSDSDGSINSYEWKEGSTVLSTAVNFTKDDLGFGAHSITLTVTDDDGATDSKTVQISIVATTQLKKTGQTKSYDENGTEVTDGSIKDDGYYQTGVTPSYTRDDATNIVTDHITGLMWQDDNDAKTVTKPWLTQTNYDICTGQNGQTQDTSKCTDTSGDTATTYCTNLTLGGYTDWRLPTIDELMYIADRSKSNPAIDTSYFQNVVSDYYWSSTTVVSGDSIAWRVHFNDGGYDFWNDKSYSYYVRCVRAGQ